MPGGPTAAGRGRMSRWMPVAFGRRQRAPGGAQGSGGQREQGRRPMSKPFDATLKDLAAVDPVGFLAEVDAPPALPVRLLSVDLSTVTAATDVVFGLGDPLQEVVHLDVQTGPDADKHRDLLAYNVLLHRQYRVPVH